MGIGEKRPFYSDEVIVARRDAGHSHRKKTALKQAQPPKEDRAEAVFEKNRMMGGNGRFCCCKTAVFPNSFSPPHHLKI